MSDAVAFFHEHAPYSYDPITETQEQGRQRCAQELAAAEAAGKAAGLTFIWVPDPDINSSEHSDEQPPYALWQCAALDADADIVTSMGGIDFGRDGSPDSAPYARVVTAQLADDWRRAPRL